MVVTIVRLDDSGLPPRAGVDLVESTKVCCVLPTRNVPVIGGAVVVVLPFLRVAARSRPRIAASPADAMSRMPCCSSACDVDVDDDAVVDCESPPLLQLTARRHTESTIANTGTRRMLHLVIVDVTLPGTIAPSATPFGRDPTGTRPGIVRCREANIAGQPAP